MIRTFPTSRAKWLSLATVVVTGLLAGNKAATASMLIGVNANGPTNGQWLSDLTLFAPYINGTNQGGASTGNSISENGLSITGNATTNQGSSTGSTIATTYTTDGATTNILQTNRYSDSSSGHNFIDYTASGLTPGATYQVNLDFAELYYSVTGDREFGVTINGTPVLGGASAGTGGGTFDVNATAESSYGTGAGGKNQGFTESFNVVANGSGQLQIDFLSGLKNNPIINAFSIDSVAVPEPASLGLLGTGVLALGLLNRRQKVSA